MPVCMNPRGDKRFPGCGKLLPPGSAGLCARCASASNYERIRCGQCGSDDRDQAPRGCTSNFHASNVEKHGLKVPPRR